MFGKVRRLSATFTYGVIWLLFICCPVPVQAQINFQVLGQLPGGSFYSVTVRDNYAYATGKGFLLSVFDMTNGQPGGRIRADSPDIFGYQVVVAGNYAYVLTAREGLPGGAIKILDISNPASLRVVGSYGNRSYDGLIVHGNLGYVSEGAQLQVLNLSNPASPQLIRTVSLTGPLAGDGGTVVGNRLYLCEGPSGLSVWDISQPDNPQRLGILGNLGVVRSVHVSGNYAFVAAGQWLGGIQGGMRVIDVSNPASMNVVAEVLEGDNPTFPLVRVDNYLYMPIMDFSGYSLVIDISNPASPRIRGSLDGMVGGANIGANRAVSYRSARLDVWDITNRTDPTSVVAFVERVPQAVAYDSGFAFTAEEGLFSVYDVTNPSAISGVTTLLLPNNPTNDPRVRVQSGLAVVSYSIGRGKEVTLFDVSNPRNPSILSHYTPNTNVSGIALQGSWLVVAHLGGFDVVDISNRLAPVRVYRKSSSWSDHPQGVAVAGGLLFSADNDRVLRVYDFSNPAAPVLRGQVSVASSSYVADVDASGSVAVVMLSNGDAVVVDVSDPSQPRVVASWDNPREATASPRVRISGNMAYVSDGLSLTAFDLSRLPAFAPVAVWQGPAREAVASGDIVYVAAGTEGFYTMILSAGGGFVVQEITPSFAAPVGAVQVNVFGDGFESGATFRLERNGDVIEATRVTFVSATQLSGTLNVDGKPDESVWDVVVRNPGGREARKAGAFLIAYPRPVVNSVSPASAANVGQVELTVAGDRFDEGATFWLERDGEQISAADIARNGATQLRGKVNLDGKAEGSVWDVVVRNPTGKTGRLSQAFTIVRPVPVISSITPARAWPRTETLTILGSGFLPGARVEFRPNVVGLNPVAATTVQVVSQFELQATFDFSGYRDYLQQAIQLSGELLIVNPNNEQGGSAFSVRKPVLLQSISPSPIIVDPANPQPLLLELRGEFRPELPAAVWLQSSGMGKLAASQVSVTGDKVRASFDASDVLQLAPSKGYWYWMVVIEQDTFAESLWIVARWPLWVSEAEPRNAYWLQQMDLPLDLAVRGEGFGETVEVVLESGSLRVRPVQLTRKSTWLIQARFDSTNLSNVTYDIVVRSGRAEARLRSAVSLEPTGDDPVRIVTWAAPTDLRINRPAAFTISLSSNISMDLPPQLIRLYPQGSGTYWLGMELAPGRLYEDFWLLTDELPAWNQVPYNFFVVPYGNPTGGVADSLKAEWINPRNAFDWDAYAARPPANVPAEEWRQRVQQARQVIGNTVKDVVNYVASVVRNFPPNSTLRHDLRALLAYVVFGNSTNPNQFPGRQSSGFGVELYVFNGLQNNNVFRPQFTTLYSSQSGNTNVQHESTPEASQALLRVQSAEYVFVLTHGYGGYWERKDEGVAKREDFNRLARTIQETVPNSAVLFFNWDTGATQSLIWASGTQVGPSSKTLGAMLQAAGIDTSRQKVVFIGESYGTYVNGGAAQYLSSQGNYNPQNVYWIGCNPASGMSGQSPFTWVKKDLFNTAVALQTNSLADTQDKGFAHHHVYLKTDKTDTVGLHTSGITALERSVRSGEMGWLSFDEAFLRKLKSGKTSDNLVWESRDPPVYGYTYDGTLDATTGNYLSDERWFIYVSGLLPSAPVRVPSAPDKELDLSHSLRSWGSRDPNEKVGTAGFGDRNFVSSSLPIGYTIFFENVATATAPAQTVVITDYLDPARYDLSTFSFGPMMVGGRLMNTPPNVPAFTTQVDLRPANNLILRISGNLDTVTGWLTWRFESLDPQTGQPTQDPLAGFLPPNQNPPGGEGWVAFNVRPKADLPDGTELRNTATIVFDENPPIQTNVVVHTIDAAPPVARVSSLAEVQSLPRFLVRWSGEDSGSGVAEYSVYYREDGGPWQQWIGSTTRTEAVFVGRFGSTYEFKARAKDYLGNEEPDLDEPEAQTQVGQPPVIPAGLRLVTLPVFTESRDSRAVLSVEPAQIAWFDSATNQYVLSPSTDVIFRPGKAFWVKLNQDAQPNIGGELPAMHQPFAISLQPGWNLVGNPWLTEWRWDVQAMQVQQNGRTLSLNEAADLVEPYAWRWDGTQYQLVFDNSILQGVIDRVQAWEGVWMFAYQPVNLIVPPPNSRAGSLRRAGRDTKSGWSVTLLAQARGKVGQVMLGATEATRALKVPAPPPPPAEGNTLQVRLLRDGQPYIADIRNQTRSTRHTWELEVVVPPGDEERATLWWQNVHRAPRGVHPVLVDLQTGERKFLRHTSSHTFAVSRQGGVYRFRVELLPMGDLLRITGVRVSGGRSQGSYTISFDINAGAQVEVTVLSAGKPVRKLMQTVTRSAGVQQVSWDGRDSNGVALPAGAYMVEVKAMGADGQVARMNVPIVLTR
ncbi:MAG: hypothetical protein KatS3mg023_1181 [Armatimonadota bacterium]|nr:MAG: hypothetical protein KatS3mg023_1181 [Armatimonadota bacterium]